MLAVEKVPTVDYPASDVDSVVVRADMESASLMRQSLQASGKQVAARVIAVCLCRASPQRRHQLNARSHSVNQFLYAVTGVSLAL